MFRSLQSDWWLKIKKKTNKSSKDEEKEEEDAGGDGEGDCDHDEEINDYYNQIKWWCAICVRFR